MACRRRWNTVYSNWTHRNKFREIVIDIHTFFIQENAVENIVWQKRRPFCLGLCVTMDAVTYPVGLSCYMTVVMVGHGDRVIGFQYQCRDSLGLRLSADRPFTLGYMRWRDGQAIIFARCLFSWHYSPFKTFWELWITYRILIVLQMICTKYHAQIVNLSWVSWSYLYENENKSSWN